MIRRIINALFNKVEEKEEYKEIVKCDRCGDWNTEPLCNKCCSKAR